MNLNYMNIINNVKSQVSIILSYDVKYNHEEKVYQPKKFKILKVKKFNNNL